MNEAKPVYIEAIHGNNLAMKISIYGILIQTNLKRTVQDVIIIKIGELNAKM